MSEEAAAIITEVDPSWVFYLQWLKTIGYSRSGSLSDARPPNLQTPDMFLLCWTHSFTVKHPCYRLRSDCDLSICSRTETASGLFESYSCWFLLRENLLQQPEETDDQRHSTVFYSRTLLANFYEKLKINKKICNQLFKYLNWSNNHPEDCPLLKCKFIKSFAVGGKHLSSHWTHEYWSESKLWTE